MNTKHLQEVEQRREDESGDVAGDGDLRILCQKRKKKRETGWKTADICRRSPQRTTGIGKSTKFVARWQSFPSSEFPKFEVSKRDFHSPLLVGFSPFSGVELPPIWFSSEQCSVVLGSPSFNSLTWDPKMWNRKRGINERPRQGPLIDKKPALSRPCLCCGNEIY